MKHTRVTQGSRHGVLTYGRVCARGRGQWTSSRRDNSDTDQQLYIGIWAFYKDLKGGKKRFRSAVEAFRCFLPLGNEETLRQSGK